MNLTCWTPFGLVSAGLHFLHHELRCGDSMDWPPAPPSPSFPSSSSPSQRRRKCIVTTVWSCSKIYIFTFHDSSGNSVRFHTQDIYVPITVRWVIFLRLCSFVRKGDLSDVRSLFTPRKESFYDQILETVINAHLWLWLNIDVICLKREAKLL